MLIWVTQLLQNLPYDVVDDLTIFMRNDPMFYRKQLFPAIMNMKDQHDAGKSRIVPQEAFGPIVDEAMESYCQQYGLGRRDKIFKLQDRDDVINKLYGEEMKQIECGAY